MPLRMAVRSWPETLRGGLTREIRSGTEVSVRVHGHSRGSDTAKNNGGTSSMSVV